MPGSDVPPPPPSPPAPPEQPIAGHRPVHVVHPSPQPQPQHQPQPHHHPTADMNHQQQRPQGPSPQRLDASLPRRPDGKVAAHYTRILLTVLDPPAGMRRTWAEAHPQKLQGDSQESLRKMVQTEEKRTRLSGRKILTMKGMSPEKRRQIERALAAHQHGDQDPRFEWLPAMVKLNTEKDGKTTFTRSMDLIIKRVPRAVIINHSNPIQGHFPQQMHPQQMHPQQMHPHQQHPHQMHPQPGHSHGRPNFDSARAAAQAAMNGAGGHGHHGGHGGGHGGGIEIVTSDDEGIIDMNKKKGKGGKHKKIEVHNNRPNLYNYSTADSDSEQDSVFSGSEMDTPESSISGDMRRRRHSSSHKHGRRSSVNHGLREHKHRSRDRVEVRPHSSRHGSHASSYSYEAAQFRREEQRREDEERRQHETEMQVRLAHTEGMLKGMSMHNDPRAFAAPRLQIDERSQYPAHSRAPSFRPYPRGPYYR